MSLALLALLGVAEAGKTWRMDLPVRPDPEATSTCAVVDGADLDIAASVTDNGLWEVSCQARNGTFTICVTVLDAYAPRRPATLRCEGERTWLDVKVVPSYDRTDDPSDGLTVVRGAREALFFETELPDAEGTLKGGHCGVQQGTLIVRPVRPMRRERTCVLTAGAQRWEVPIRVVDDPALLLPERAAP